MRKFLVPFLLIFTFLTITGFKFHEKPRIVISPDDIFGVEDASSDYRSSRVSLNGIITYLNQVYQPFSYILLSISNDKTIDVDLDNSAYPWTDNEVSDNITIGSGGAINLSVIQTACSNDFHNIGGVDDDQPDDDSEVPNALTINAQAGSTWDIADSINASSVFSGSTSLEETTSANDSGAYIVGVYNEFTNSNATNVQDVLDDLDDAISGSGAPADATYIVQTADGNLTNAQDLASLATGILKSTNGTGVVSIAVDGTDYLAPSRIDDTKGNGDTDYVWSADKVYDQLAQKYGPGDAVNFTTVDTGHGANELYKMDQNVTTTSNVTFAKVTATNGISAGATANPRARFLDSDCPGSDKFVGSIEISYVDGADGSENADIFLRSQEGGANTTQMQYDESSNTWKIPAEKNLVLEGGYIVGKVKRGNLISANTTLTTTDLHGTVYTVNATCTVTLDAASDVGYDWVSGFRVRGAHTLTLKPDASDKFDLHGTVLSAGTGIESPGNAGDFIFIMSSTDVDGSGTDGYETWGYGEAPWSSL